jgi:hypothetical protein
MPLQAVAEVSRTRIRQSAQSRMVPPEAPGRRLGLVHCVKGRAERPARKTPEARREDRRI